MAILIDFNQVVISSLMAHVGYKGKNDEMSEELIRHMVLTTILYYKKKFQNKYGEVVICTDAKKYWRKEAYPYYKAGRKKLREDSNFDWNLIFNTLNKIREELKENFPYKVIQVEGAEADDVIASICKHESSNNSFIINNSEPILILSSDTDFVQLQKYDNVEQFSPMQKKFVRTDNPTKYLKEHIITGDTGDGIPNFLTQDDYFVTRQPGAKQKGVNKKKLEVWLSQEPEQFCDDNTLKYYRRNELLIDLSKVPEELQKNVIEEYQKPPKGIRRNLLNYFVKNRLKILMENLSDF